MEGFEILFVDDEVEILDTVGEYLSQEGYKVTPSTLRLMPYDFFKTGHGLRLRFQPVGLTGRRVETRLRLAYEKGSNEVVCPGYA